MMQAEQVARVNSSAVGVVFLCALCALVIVLSPTRMRWVQ